MLQLSDLLHGFDVKPLGDNRFEAPLINHYGQAAPDAREPSECHHRRRATSRPSHRRRHAQPARERSQDRPHGLLPGGMGHRSPLPHPRYRPRRRQLRHGRNHLRAKGAPDLQGRGDADGARPRPHPARAGDAGHGRSRPCRHQARRQGRVGPRHRRRRRPVRARATMARPSTRCGCASPAPPTTTPSTKRWWPT